MEDENTQPLLNVIGAPDPDKVVMFAEEIVTSEKRNQVDLNRLLDIRRKNNPEEPVETVYARTEKDVRSGLANDYMDQELNYVATQKQVQVLDELSSAWGGEIVDFTSQAQTIQDIKHIKDFYTDVDGFEQAMIAAQVPQGIDDFRAQRKAVHNRAMGLVANLAEEDGVLDTISNVVGMAAPDYVWDTVEMMDGMEGFLGSAWPKWVEEFKLKGPDAQNVLVESLVPALYKHYDSNPYKVMARVEELFDSYDARGTHSFNVAWDLSSVPDLMAVKSGARALKNLGNSSQRAVDNEAINEAAALQAIAAQGGTTAEKAIGVTKLDAANTINPNRTNFIGEHGDIDAISGNVQIVNDQPGAIVPSGSTPDYENVIGDDQFNALKHREIELEQSLRALESQKTTVSLSEGDARRKISQIKADLLDTTISETRKKALQADMAKLEASTTKLDTLKSSLKLVKEKLESLKTPKIREVGKDTQKVVDEAEAHRMKSALEKEEAQIQEAIKAFKFEQGRLADEKLPRGDMKALVKEKEQLQAKLTELKAKRDKVPTSAKGSHKVQQEQKAERIALNDNIEDLRSRIRGLSRQIDSTKPAVEAEGDLSRLSQGITPQKLQAELDAIRQTLKAAKLPESVRQAKTSQLAQGVVPPEMREAVKVESVKQSAKMQSEIQALQTPSTLPLVAPMGHAIPKAAVYAEKIKTLMKSIIRPPILSPEEAALAERKAIEALQAQLSLSGTEVNAIEVVSRDYDSITLKYKTASGEGEHTYRITRDDVGTTISENASQSYKQSWVNSLGKLFSQETLIGSFNKEMVGDTTFAGQQAAKIQNKIAELWRDAEAGLSKEELFQIDAIMKLGDEEGISTGIEQYTIAQLRSGSLETAVGRFALNNRQIEAYYIKRSMYRELHGIMDNIIKQRLEFEGFENLKYVENNIARNLIGRKLKNFDLSDVKDNEAVFFPGDPVRTNKTTKVDLLKQHDNLKDQGYQVVSLLEPKLLADGREARYALVKGDVAEWGRLPNQVLNYSPGYVPRIYRPGYHFVRNMASDAREVLFAFETKGEADTWAREYTTNGGKAAVFRDGEFGRVGKALDDARAYGGLYTTPRKQQPLLLKTAEGNKALERMSVGQATERYINNIAKVMPLNEYRMAAVQRWENDVNSFGAAHGRGGLGATQRFDIDPAELDLPEDIKKVMLQTRDYIKEVMGVAPPEERITETIALGAANLMYGKSYLSKTRNWLLNNSKGSLSSWLRGNTFHFGLGYLNPAQLIVQGNNAAIAMALEPKYAALAMGDYLAHSFVSLGSESGAIKAARGLGFSDETIESLEQYHKSGMRASITSNADFDVHDMGIAHTSMDTVRKLKKKGLYLYRTGENTARLVSWNIARRKWKDANPGKKIGDNDILDISKEATRMLMNMQAENAAKWQKGALGIPTQFMQAQAKFLENIMPKALGGSTKWTEKQKMQVLASQIVLYGTVGVPFIEEASSFAGSLLGQDPQEFVKNNPGWVTQINEGVVGTTLGLLGAGNLNASERLSLLSGVDNMLPIEIAKAVNTHWNGGMEEMGFIETMQGPSATMLSRSGDLISNFVLQAKTLYTVPTLDVAYGAIMSNLESVASMTSTWTNAEKAYYLNKMGILLSGKGKVVATSQELGPLSLVSQLGMAMGFKTDMEIALYSSKETLKNSKELKKKVETMATKALDTYLVSGNKEHYEASIGFLFLPLDPMQSISVMDKVIESRGVPTSALEKTRTETMSHLIQSGEAPTQAQQTVISGNTQ